MNELTCRVLVFFKYTTACFTATPSAENTAPFTLRVWSDPFFFFSCARTADAHRNKTTKKPAKNLPTRFSLPTGATPTRRVASVDARLLPVFVLFFLFFFVVLEEVVVFVFLFQLFRRFHFQRTDPRYPQVRSTLVATDGVAFFDILCVHINRATAYRALEHR